jgi:hypothetical protein
LRAAVRRRQRAAPGRGAQSALAARDQLERRGQGGVDDVMSSSILKTVGSI